MNESTCPKCGRPMHEAGYGEGPTVDECASNRGRDLSCEVMHRAFIRGAEWMCDVAKDKAEVVGPECDAFISFRDVDAELERRKSR